jgi:hypothetical protein
VIQKALLSRKYLNEKSPNFDTRTLAPTQKKYQLGPEKTPNTLVIDYFFYIYF